MKKVSIVSESEKREKENINTNKEFKKLKRQTARK
jgi:hypothetical protein